MTMVASFMPSLAFAVTGPDDHDYAVAVSGSAGNYTVVWADVQNALKGDDAEYIEVVKEPTHTEKGEVKLACTKDFCEEVITAKTFATPSHDDSDDMVERDFTLEAYAAAMLAQKATGFENSYKANKWVKDQKEDDKCYVKNAKVCSCGFVEQGVTPVDHVTKTSCVDYACAKCGATIEGTDHNWTVVTDPAKKVSEPTCKHGTGYKSTCTVCDAEGVYYDDSDKYLHSYGTPVAGMEFVETDSVNKTGYWTGTAVNVAASTKKSTVKEGYIAVLPNGTVCEVGAELAKDEGQKFYKYSKVKDATCASGKVYEWDCAECGSKLKEKTVGDVAHNYEKTHVAATCDAPGHNDYVCTVCGHTYSEDIDTEPQLQHSYVVTKTAATCKTAEYYTISCTTCKKNDIAAHNDIVVNDSNAVSLLGAPIRTDAVKKTRTFVFTGFGAPGDVALTGNQVIEIEISTAAAGDHKYTTEELVKPATCTTDEVWAKKCTVCGKISTHVETGNAPYTKKNTRLGHDAVKTVIAPTCGTAGFYTEQCSRCGLYKQTADGKDTTVAGVEVKGWTKDIDNAIQTKDANPVVAKGTACTFDKWVVTKASTVFEEGVKTLTCSVCGHADGTKTVVAKKTVAKAAPTVKAGKKSLTVKATAANATGYRVYYKKAGAKSWKSYTKKTASLSKTFSGLSKGKYYVKVKAYAKNYAGDGQVVWGATSSTKSVKVK